MSVEIRQACSEDVEVLVQLRVEMRRERENCQLSIPEKDFAAVIPAEGRVFDELKNEAVSLAKERDASVLLAVKTWR